MQTTVEVVVGVQASIIKMVIGLDAIVLDIFQILFVFSMKNDTVHIRKEQEMGERRYFDRKDLIDAANLIRLFCKKIDDDNEDKCPFLKDGKCLLNHEPPYNWPEFKE